MKLEAPDLTTLMASRCSPPHRAHGLTMLTVLMVSRCSQLHRAHGAHDLTVLMASRCSQRSRPHGLTVLTALTAPLCSQPHGARAQGASLLTQSGPQAHVKDESSNLI